jgi:DNA-3-methyladenine glycosylase I
MAEDTKIRCEWCMGDDLYEAYHDNDWGVPLHDDRLLFEAIILDGAQAGLSWITILRRRENYRAAFDNFDIATVAAYDEDKIAALLQDAGIIRNKAKVRSAVTNAQAALKIQAEFGSLDKYMWSFVGGKPMVNAFKTMSEIPTESEESRAMSKDLKKRGFKFVGPTICYALMQAVGMFNDHTVDCYRYGEVEL